MLLRPYQSDALAAVQSVYRSGRRRALLVAPTGAGKSAMTRYMLDRTQQRTMILCHRAELLEMISESLSVPHDIIGPSSRSLRHRVQVGMMQTVSRRLDTLPAYGWVISDEAHLAMCQTWRSILQHYSAAWHLGLSATPCRLDGQGLGGEYEQIVHGPSIRELTDRGYLSPCRVFAPALSGRVTRKSGSEVNLAEAAASLDTSKITGDAVDHYRRLAPGRQAIVFCCSRAHADHVASIFTMAGFPAVNVDGSMPAAERRQRIADFRARRLMVLTNVDLLTTGFDCPQIECGIFLRPTMSLALYLQMVGRILRIHPGKKDAILLDHVGNVVSHGMPDAPREWTLDGRPKREALATVATCPKCYAAHRPAPRCPSCGHVYAGAPKPRRVEEQAGQLEEVDGKGLEQIGGLKFQAALKDARRRTTDQEARAALSDLAKAMGYKPGWVQFQMQLRQRYRLGASARDRAA